MGTPGDVFENQADQIADQVVHMPDQALQRQPMEEEEEMLQPKLLPGQPTPAIQRHPMEEEEERLQPKLLPGQGTPILQMQPMEEEEEMLQPKRQDHSYSVANEQDGIQDRIHEMRGGGQPLSSSERSYFEPRLGNDLSDVRIHTNEHASDIAQGMQARAFTVGHDIAFNQGQYDSSSTEGKKLMAHELVHVAQQTGVTPLSDPMVQRYPDRRHRVVNGFVNIPWGNGRDEFIRNASIQVQRPPLNIPAVFWETTRFIQSRSNIRDAYESVSGLMERTLLAHPDRSCYRMRVHFNCTGAPGSSVLRFTPVEPHIPGRPTIEEPTETPTSRTEEVPPATPPPPAAPPTPRARTRPGEDIGDIMVRVRRRAPERRLEEVLADVGLMLERYPTRPRDADRINLHRLIRAMLDAAPRDRRREVGEYIRTSLRDEEIDIVRTAITPINRGTLTLLGITPAAATRRDWQISGNQITLDRPISCISHNGSLYRSSTLRVGMSTFLSHHNNIGRVVVIRSISSSSIGVRIYNFDESTGSLRDVRQTSWDTQELGTQISLQTLSGLRVWQPIATVVAIVSIVILTAGTSSIVGAGAATAAELGISSGAHLLLTAVQAGLVAGITNFIHRHQADMMRGAQQGNAGRFWELPQYSLETHMRNFLYDFLTGTATSYISRMGSTGPADEFGSTMWSRIATPDRARLIVAFILRRLQESLTSVVGGLVGLGRDLYNARNQAARDRAVRSFRQTVLRAFTVDLMRGMVSNNLR